MQIHLDRHSKEVDRAECWWTLTRIYVADPGDRSGGIFLERIGFPPSLGIAGADGPLIDDVGLQIYGKNHRCFA